MSASRVLVIGLLTSLVLAGCNCGIIDDPEAACRDNPKLCADLIDSGVIKLPDSGTPSRRDSGYADGGRVWTEFNFPAGTAYEPCTGETIANAHDSGYADSNTDVYLPLCVALREVSGKAELNAAPVTASIQWEWKASGYSSAYDGSPDQQGNYKVNVLRANYPQGMTWHPSSIFPTHSGPLATPSINLLTNATRNVATKSFKLSGTLTFDGLPWLTSLNPADVQLAAANTGYQQAATTPSLQGAYSVNFVEGSYQVEVTVPPEALGSTKLQGFPLGLIALTQNTTLSKDIPASQLTGTVKLDGAAIPARAASGPDWFIEYEESGQVVAVTHHQGDDANIRAMVPRGGYALNLGFPTGTNRTLPAYLYHRRLTSSVDLTQDAVVNIDLATRTWEGALLVDGQPVPQNAGGVWTLYAYGYDQGANNPWFVSYYDVPFTSSAFALRLFPAMYYTQVYVDDRFHPQLMAGWYTHDRQLEVFTHISSVIDIQTAELTGTILIDGVPASAASNVGSLILSGASGTYRRKIDTSDGSFTVRVPQGNYDVTFAINEDAYPEYATGRFTVAQSLELGAESTSVMIDYKTVRVSGPLAVQNAPVPNTSPSVHELSLRLFPAGSGTTWTKKLEGGKGFYSFRIPEGDWDVDVRIEERALPDTAWGVAPYVDAYPMRPQR